MNHKSINLLNKAVADELSAIHQYMYFYFHCHDQGLETLANLFRSIANEEMRHIEQLSERILFLNGDVEMKPLQDVSKIRSVKAILDIARQMEEECAHEFTQWAATCATFDDLISKQLFETLAAEEQKHFKLFDTELMNIEKFGDSYLTLQSMEGSKHAE